MSGIRPESTDVTATLFRGSGILHSLSVAANGGASNAQIYDGVSANGKLIFNIGLLDGAGFSPYLASGLQISHGIHVVCADANIQVTVGFTNDGIQ